MVKMNFQDTKMKNIILFTILVIFFSASCDKIKLSEIKPMLLLKISEGYVYSDTSISAGRQYTLGITASSANGENLTNLIVESNGNRLIDKGFNTPEYIEDVVLTKSNEDEENLQIIVFNKAKKSDTLSIVVSNLLAQYAAINRYSDILLGAQNNTGMGNYFSLSNGQVYSQSEAYNNQQLIDIVYYYDPSGDANTLASPGANLTGIITGTDSPDYWTTKRTTRYCRAALVIKEDEFNSAANDSLIVANLFTDGGRKAKQLQNNQYYGFQTNDGKFGIIRIKTVSGLAEGNIQFSLIFQQ